MEKENSQSPKVKHSGEDRVSFFFKFMTLIIFINSTESYTKSV